jgi:hypothetical protein
MCPPNGKGIAKVADAAPRNTPAANWESHRLLDGSKSSRSAFAAATGLGFAGFFFPRLQTVLGID